MSGALRELGSCAALACLPISSSVALHWESLVEGAVVLALEEADALGLESPALGVSCGLEPRLGHSVGEANKPGWNPPLGGLGGIGAVPHGVPSLLPPLPGVRPREVGLRPREGGSPTT